MAPEPRPRETFAGELTSGDAGLNDSAGIKTTGYESEFGQDGTVIPYIYLYRGDWAKSMKKPPESLKALPAVNAERVDLFGQSLKIWFRRLSLNPTITSAPTRITGTPV